MIARLWPQRFASAHWGSIIICAVVLAGALVLGFAASLRFLVLLAAVVAALAFMQVPALRLEAIVVAALLIRFELGTGTEVALNPVTLLVPAVAGLWLVEMLLGQKLELVPSRVNRPLILFLLAGLLSLLIGNALWNPAVPRSESFTLVQLAQWAIFAFSAAAFWLTANRISSGAQLQRLTLFYLAVAGSLGIVTVLTQLVRIPLLSKLVGQVATFAVYRAPFWMLLTAIPAGQLLFNRRLSTRWRAFLWIVLLAVAVFSLYLERKTLANWVGSAAVVAVLFWLRWPRLRWPVLLVLVALVVTGFLSSAVYEFAGGEAEWEESGGSRLALINRVVSVTMRNPITGLGPASYRPYTRLEPLPYMGALWLEPVVSSHNNYVDIFAHTGLVGLGLFGWFAVELGLLGVRLRKRFVTGFAAGYVNAMIAVWAGALTLMLFADWILPFVYNIGFPGFQASVLVWLFLGGLGALQHITVPEEGA